MKRTSQHHEKCLILTDHYCKQIELKIQFCADKANFWRKFMLPVDRYQNNENSRQAFNYSVNFYPAFIEI
jgi:hypothetical protein